MADLKLQVLLSMLDKVTAPLRKINAASKASGDTLRKTRDALRALDKTQQAVGEFRKLKEGARAIAVSQRELQQRIRDTAREMRASETPSAELARKFKKLTDEAGKLKAKESEQLAKLQQLRSKLSEAGIATGKLASGEAKLRSDIASTTASMDKQTAALRAQGEQMRKVQGLRDKLGKAQATAAHLSVAGYAGLYGGRHLIEAVHPMLDEGKQYQQHIAQMRAQGASAADIAQAERFANDDTTRGSSINDKLEILKDANSIFRDMHEAVAVAPQLLKAKYTFDALMAQQGQGEGKGGETVNQLIDAIRTGELRNATKSPADFTRLLDMMTRAYVGSGGLVKPSDYLEAMKVGGVALKQMDEKSLFFGAMHTIQEMGGMRSGTGFATGYQNWATGRSTQQAAEALAALGLVNKDAVKYGKNGHITKMLPGALVNQQLYETNPFEYLMKEVIPRINPSGKLSDDAVVSKLNALFSGRKGGDLFVGMYMQRANIMKQLAASQRFAGLNETYKQTGATAQGEEVDLLAKKRDLYLQLGTQLLPLYVGALQKLTTAVRAATEWAKNHPRLAKLLSVVGASLGVLSVVAGGAMIALGGLIGQLALLRFVAIRGKLALFGGRAASAMPAATAAMRGAMPPPLPRVGLLARARGMVSGVGRIFPAMAGGARAAMLAITGVSLPVMALVAALAALAIVVWKYWAPIKAWFTGFGKGLWESLKPAFDALGAALGPLKPAWDAIAGAIGTVWDWIVKLFEPFHATQTQLDGATESGASFGRIIGDVLASLLKPITWAIKAFVGLGEAIGTAIGWCVVKGVEVIDWFSTHWGGITAALKAPFVVVFKWVTDKATAAWEAMKATWSALRQFFAGLWTAVKAPFVAGFAWIIDKATAAWDWLKASVGGVVEAFKAAWDTLKGWFGALWEAIKAPFVAGFAWIIDKATAAWDWLKASVGGVVEAFKAAWDTLKGWFGALWEAIKAPFVAGFAWIEKKLDDALAAWEKVKKALTTDSAAGQALAVARDAKQSAGTRAAAALVAGLAMANPVAAAAFDATAGKPKIAAQQPLRAQGAGGTTHNSYTVHVTAAPGREQDAARAASAELDRREREKAARRRSGLTDYE